LTFKEVLDWVESNPNVLALFTRFGIKMILFLFSDVDYKIKENVNTFKPIKTYSRQESLNIFKLMGLPVQNDNFYHQVKFILQSQRVIQTKNKNPSSEEFTKSHRLTTT